MTFDEIEAQEDKIRTCAHEDVYSREIRFAKFNLPKKAEEQTLFCRLCEGWKVAEEWYYNPHQVTDEERQAWQVYATAALTGLIAGLSDDTIGRVGRDMQETLCREASEFADGMIDKETSRYGNLSPTMV